VLDQLAAAAEHCGAWGR